MVNLGNLYETFLLGDAWLEFEGYPRKIGRVYTENFVQEMSVVFAYGEMSSPLLCILLALYSTSSRLRGE